MSRLHSALPVAFSACARAVMPLATLAALVACGDSEPVAPVRGAATPSTAVVSGTQAKPQRIAFVIKQLSENLSIWSANADGTDLFQITSGAYNDEMPAWSPDRKKLVFARGTGAGRELMMINANGNLLKSLGVAGFNPRWSPDGTKIIYGAYDATQGNHNIFTINADGSNVVRLTDDPENDVLPSFSADGKKIAFMSLRSGSYELYVMNADGTGAQKLTDCASEAAFCSDVSWSPVPGDQRILFRIGHPVNKVRTINADGTGLTNVLGTLNLIVTDPVWSPDATKLAFIAVVTGDTTENVWTANLDGTGLDRVTFLAKDKMDVAWAR